jgi:hypothetical protein
MFNNIDTWKNLTQYYKTYTDVLYNVLFKARVFVTDKTFQPSLMLVSEARSLS